MLFRSSKWDGTGVWMLCRDKRDSAKPLRIFIGEFEPDPSGWPTAHYKLYSAIDAKDSVGVSDLRGGQYLLPTRDKAWYPLCAGGVRDGDLLFHSAFNNREFAEGARKAVAAEAEAANTKGEALQARNRINKWEGIAGSYGLSGEEWQEAHMTQLGEAAQTADRDAERAAHARRAVEEKAVILREKVKSLGHVPCPAQIELGDGVIINVIA